MLWATYVFVSKINVVNKNTFLNGYTKNCDSGSQFFTMILLYCFVILFIVYYDVLIVNCQSSASRF